MKLNIITQHRITNLALAEDIAEAFIYNLYTLTENVDFFGRMMNSIERKGRSSPRKPERKKRSDFSTDEEYERYLANHEKELAEYYKERKGGKSSSGSSSPSGGTAGASAQASAPASKSPYATALGGLLSAGAAAAKAKIAPGVSSSNDALIKTVTAGRSDSAKVAGLIKSAGTIDTDILTNSQYLKQFFDSFGISTESARESILAQVKASATSTESYVARARALMDMYDREIVDKALKKTVAEFYSINPLLTEAGIRQAFDAARRFVAQPEAVAASSAQSKQRSVNVNNAKLLAQKCIEYLNEALSKAKSNIAEITQLQADLNGADANKRNRAQARLNAIKKQMGL